MFTPSDVSNRHSHYPDGLATCKIGTIGRGAHSDSEMPEDESETETSSEEETQPTTRNWCKNRWLGWSTRRESHSTLTTAIHTMSRVVLWQVSPNWFRSQVPSSDLTSSVLYWFWPIRRFGSFLCRRGILFNHRMFDQLLSTLYKYIKRDELSNNCWYH